MTDIAYKRFIDELRERGPVTETNGTARAKCPAHNGNSNTSLAITPIEGSVLVYCHAGCPTTDVLAAIQWQMRDLYDDRKGARYDYHDGRRVHRTPNKNFYQKGNTEGQALFHAEHIGDAETVYIPEGEKDVLAIETIGGAAICSAMGAGKAHKFDWSPVKGKTVVIIADKDDPGRKHAIQIAELLDGIAETITIKEATVGKDAADHIAAGHTLEELVDTDWWTPPQPITITQAHTVFKRWLGDDYDTDALDVMLSRYRGRKIQRRQRPDLAATHLRTGQRQNRNRAIRRRYRRHHHQRHLIRRRAAVRHIQTRPHQRRHRRPTTQNG